MMRRFLRRLFRRSLPGPSPEEAIRSAETHLRNAETHVAAQCRESATAVNFLYDRIAPTDRGEA